MASRNEPSIGDAKQIRVLRRKQLETRLGVGRSTIYDLLRHDSSFPRPVRIGRRAIGWVSSEIESWLAQRMAERR
jgi:prophage regulatory protein